MMKTLKLLRIIPVAMTCLSYAAQATTGNLTILNESSCKIEPVLPLAQASDFTIESLATNDNTLAFTVSYNNINAKKSFFLPLQITCERSYRQSIEIIASNNRIETRQPQNQFYAKLQLDINGPNWIDDTNNQIIISASEINAKPLDVTN